MTCLIKAGIINRKFYEHLEKVAPFKVKSPEESIFADWTDEEMRALLGAKLPEDYQKPIEKEPTEEEKEILKALPSSYDFRTSYSSCMLGIRDQASCGSCWAFSTATAFQERLCRAGGTNKLMSPQYLVSCETNSYGCDGGYIYYAWNLIKSTGIVAEECWPYSSASGTVVDDCLTSCKVSGKSFTKYRCSSVANIAATESSVKQAVYDKGPISSSFTVYEDFYYYDTGIYQHTSGQELGGHAIVIIGYGEQNGVKYYICQNSWTQYWGENGYFRIKIGDCGIGDYNVAGTI